MSNENLKSITPVFLFTLLFSSLTQAQITTGSLDGRINTINTAVPFLRISPDARSGAMGDVGVAISPDANAIHWNAAKLAFADKDMGLSVTYTPWLRALKIDDIYLAYLSGYKRIDDQQTVGISVRYFSLGQIVFTNLAGIKTGNYNPNEFAIAGAYTRKLSNKLSGGITLRYIYSDLAKGQTVSGIDIEPGDAAAADISIFYNDEILLSGQRSSIAFGATISNIGSKITYTASIDRDFIPTNFAIGSALTVPIDEYNRIGIAFDINKLLVPTPSSLDLDANNRLDYKEKSPIDGALGSFSDAPGGFAEEIHELMYSLGLEYWYTEQFAVRAGYLNEHSTKGNRKYFTVGLGVNYQVFELNFSYLVPTSNQPNPLDNTVRFSLMFDFDAFTPMSIEP